MVMGKLGVVRLGIGAWAENASAAYERGSE